MTLFYLLLALFVLDAITKHVLMRISNIEVTYRTSGKAKEIGPIARFFYGKTISVQENLSFLFIKMAGAGYLFMYTEEGTLFHEGLVIGAVGVVIFNLIQIYRLYQEK